MVYGGDTVNIVKLGTTNFVALFNGKPDKAGVILYLTITHIFLANNINLLGDKKVY